MRFPFLITYRYRGTVLGWLHELYDLLINDLATAQGRTDIVLYW